MTEKVVAAKVAAGSYVMTDHTREHIAVLVRKVMHPRGVHHFVYDSAARHHADEKTAD